MSESELESLRFEREAARLHRALFDDDPPDVLVERFTRASQRMNAGADPAEVQRYYEAIDRVNDLEALEIAGRYTRRLPLLSRKLQLMVHLSESLPQYQRHFINERTSLARGVSALLLGGVWSGVKLAKGLVLLRSRVRG